MKGFRHNRQRKLSDDAVMRIPELLLAGREWREISVELGIAISAFGYIMQGKTYKHLQNVLQHRLVEVRVALKTAPKTCTRCFGVFPRTVEFFEPKPRRDDIFRSECRVCVKQLAQARYRRVKLEVMTHYSNGVPRCACCDERTLEFLTIDHVDGGGNAHRRSISKSGASSYPMYGWLKNKHFPMGFRVLCMNCNMSYGQHGYCPHQGVR